MRGFIVFSILSVIVSPAFGADLESRVAELERKVKTLEDSKPSIGIPIKRRPVYSITGNCAFNSKYSAGYNYDHIFQVIKKNKCENQEWVITSHVVPPGYVGAGTTSIDVYRLEDVVLP